MKNKKKEYQVKYRVCAIIGINVKAGDQFDAKDAADKIITKQIFIDDLEIIDEEDKYIGFDDMDGWKIR